MKLKNGNKIFKPNMNIDYLNNVHLAILTLKYQPFNYEKAFTPFHFISK